MVGTIIGTYRLEELLGDGGLGGVYRAVDTASGKEAAFRLFAREVSGDAMLADRLRAMTPALKKLQHPNVAAFFELVNVGDGLALFLEYVPGASLDKVRQPSGRLEVSVAVSCAVQVLRALEFAHSAGVLHHALRPSNVMVTRQGTVKVLDFGIGHAFGANRKTREDRLLTVLGYLAPEQIQNQPGDARSDIYAVGVLLYELLTGKLPFDHRTEFALRHAHLAEPPVAPRAIVAGLPEWLDQAILRALAKQPASRYQNATEFRAVLEAALGLSTSREAAIVRQRDGGSLETFAAAPPIPPPPAATPSGDATGGGGAVQTVATDATRTGSDTVDTVMAGVPVPSGADGQASSSAGPAGAQTGAVAPRTRKRGPAILVALLLAVAGVAGTGAYLWLRGQASPASGDTASESGQAGTTQTPAASPAASESPSAAVPQPTQAEAPAAAVPPAIPASPVAKPAAGPPQPPGRKAPAPPAQAVTSATAAPAAGAPDVTAPAGAAAAAAPAGEKAPDVSYRKVKLITQAGSSEKSTDVVLLFSDDRVSVTPADGGAALRTVRYAEISAASYSKAQKKRLGFIKSARHLLELDTAGEPLLLRLDSSNVEAVLAAVEARTGQAVSR